MIKNSSTIKASGILTASHYNKTKTCYLNRKEHDAVIYKSTIWYAVLFGPAFRIFTSKRKAFAKYAIINKQYTGASTNGYFPSESLSKHWLFMLEYNIIKKKKKPVYNSIMETNVYLYKGPKT